MARRGQKSEPQNGTMDEYYETNSTTDFEKDELDNTLHEMVQTKREKKLELCPDLIPIVNDLRNKLLSCDRKLDVSLPQIAVIGNQSAGKSSVLERFVGKEFLPRGTNTVTRRPIIVQMIPSQKEEYALFNHKENVRFEDFSKVEEEIKNETRRHPGPKGFSAEPITIRIYSPNVLELTVVDLPGVISGVEDGHDSACIQEVRNMVLDFIRPEETLILAVTESTEIVNSVAMSVAKEVDPERKRTIGILTKLDELSEGTDRREILENKKIFLEKGYVGVVNRNQKEVDDGRDFEYIAKKEKDFFANHPAYKHMKDVMGVPFLVKLLQDTLRAHIKQCLPKLRSDLSQELSECRRELKNFEERMGNNNGLNKDRDDSSKIFIIKLIQDFIEAMNIQLDGNSELVDTKQFTAGAKICYKFCTTIRKNLTLTITPDENQTLVLIANISGIRTPIAIPSLTVDTLNRIVLQKYKAPIKDSVQCIKELLESVIEETARATINYPSLKNEILHYIRLCIDKEAESTKTRLESHIDVNMYCINYKHPDFDNTIDSSAPAAGPIDLWENASVEEGTDHMMDSLKQSEGNQKNLKFAISLLMKNLVPVQKQIEDISIKYIKFYLVKQVHDFIKKDLLVNLIQSSNFSSLAKDCDVEFRWKEKTENSCKVLEEALNAIQDF